MLYDNIELHNVDHLRKVDGMSGLRLERFPDQFRNELGIKENQNGRFRASRSHGCELRFVTESDYFDLALTAVEADIDIVVYFGDRFHSKHTLVSGQCSVVHIMKPEIYDTVNTKELLKGRFEANVWRILIGLNGYLHFNYLDTFGHDKRPPKANEKPEIRWAAYGSSITCGSVTTAYSNSYINQAAIRLGYDVLNKGLSGACFCENFVADYLSKMDVEMITLELGVNMVMFFEEEEFEKRVSYLLQQVLTNPKLKKIYVIDMFLNKGKIDYNEKSSYYRHYSSFKEIVKRRVNELKDKRMVHIAGEWILKDFSYLSTDLLHPSDEGHIRMGQNLAQFIQNEMEERIVEGG